MEEAHRFGILNTDEDLRIIEFLEKPEKSNFKQKHQWGFIFSIGEFYVNI